MAGTEGRYAKETPSRICSHPLVQSRTWGSCGRDRGKKGGHSMISEHQKEAILTMRQQGCSYPAIAERLILSPNTVKSICRRNGVRVLPTEKSAPDICKNCGAPLQQNTGRKKTFCSDKCRYAWWNQSRRKEPYQLTCFYCGRKFISFGNKKRKFCGRECYILSRYGEGLP